MAAQIAEEIRTELRLSHLGNHRLSLKREFVLCGRNYGGKEVKQNPTLDARPIGDCPLLIPESKMGILLASSDRISSISIHGEQGSGPFQIADEYCDGDVRSAGTFPFMLHNRAHSAGKGLSGG